MSDFIYPVEQISTDSVLYFKQFTHRQNKNFVKVLLNGDTNILEMFVSTLIKDLSVNDIDTDNLSCIDKLGILLGIRAYNVSPVAKFTTIVDKGRQEQFEISVNDVIDKIKQHKVAHTFNIDKNGIKVEGTIPKVLAAENQLDMITSSIDVIEFNGNAIDARELTLDQRREVIDKLPSFVLSSVLEFLYEQEQILKTTPVIKLGSDQEMHLSFINRSIAEIIRLFFNTDLKQFYETEYTLIKHFNFTHESINNCAPAELMLYYNIINEEIKKQKEEEQKQQSGQSVNPNNSLKG
tara:strand:- start:35470 stop:36351 length:882 start_codon:yes stop_codon:yes gene_type:complete